MARANYESSDDELPTLSDIFRRRRQATAAARLPSTEAEAKTPKLPGGLSMSERSGEIEGGRRSQLTVQPCAQKAKASSTATRRQRLLRPATIDNRLACRADASTFGSIASFGDGDITPREAATAVRRTPARVARKAANYTVQSKDSESHSDTQAASDPDSSNGSGADSGNDVEESLWCGSDGDQSADDGELHGVLPLRQKTQRPATKDLMLKKSTLPTTSVETSRGVISSNPGTAFTHQQPLQDAIEAPVLEKSISNRSPLERPSSSSSIDQDAFLRYSPPRRKSPHKLSDHIDRPRTPSPSSGLSRPRLVSPSKKNRIPTPPHRPSLDAFWAADVVNAWNDQHSPRKVLQSPRKEQRFSTPENDPFLQSSPRKINSTKTGPARRSFEQRKHQLAGDFLRELDDTITQGRISSLAAECGGVRLVWSKTLTTTAGRANWKRESLTTLQNGTSVTRHRHHASIELAEKVIDDEDRLVNVIAHEFCHLANFMISNVRDNPHGKEFKEWGRKVTRAFGHRNINVTTKHSYAIDYKYVWVCVECGHEFKRHSKSIDPAKHRCGSCKAELAQIKPAVRQKDSSKGPSEYHIFMKENFQRIKRENEGKCHRDIMEILGKEYRACKASKDTASGADIDLTSIAKAIGTIALDD